MKTLTFVNITVLGLAVAGSLAGCGGDDDSSGGAGASGKAGSSAMAGSSGSGASAGKGGSGGSAGTGTGAKGGSSGTENTAGANSGGEAGQSQGGGPGEAQGGEGGQGTAGVPSNAGAGGASDCTPPDPSVAPVIVSTRGTGRFPTDQAGGRIESGTYYETTFTDYNGAGGDQRHGIMIIDTAARTFNVAEGAVDGHASITLATFRTSGSDLVLSPDCGNNGTSRTLRYTSDRGVITIYNPTSNVTTYTKQ